MYPLKGRGFGHVTLFNLGAVAEPLVSVMSQHISCATVVSRLGTGIPTQMIDDPSTCQPVHYLISPLPYHNQTTHYLIAARSRIPA